MYLYFSMFSTYSFHVFFHKTDIFYNFYLDLVCKSVLIFHVQLTQTLGVLFVMPDDQSSEYLKVSQADYPENLLQCFSEAVSVEKYTNL